jgi:hypothetical protein
MGYSSPSAAEACLNRHPLHFSLQSLHWQSIIAEGRAAVLDGQGRYEVIFTVLVAIFLIVAAKGRHAYGFYVVRLAATVGAVYWAVRVYHAGPRAFRKPRSL